jgi:hypothetical protein
LGAFFVERLTSNKEGKNSKCFAERRFLSRNLAPGCTVVIPNSLGHLRHEAFCASLASSTYGVRIPVTPVR